MPHVLENVAFLDIDSLTVQLGGILFTPSVFIDCLISSESRSSIYCDAVLRILGRSSDFLLDSHITETDKNIVKDNLKNARKGKYLSAGKYSIIENALNSLKVIKCNHAVEEYAHYRSRTLPLYDARRIEVALQNDLTLLTCTPEHFTQDPDEQVHIFQHGYANVCVGTSIDIDNPDKEMPAEIWVFNPKTLAILFNDIGDKPTPQLSFTDRDEQLYFVSYKLDANNSGSRSRIRLSYNNRVLVGETSQKGPIDSILRSIEQALNEEMDFRNVSVHHRVSDTTTEKSTIRVSIRVYKTSPGSENILPGYIEATDESEDLLFSTARAYVKALNTMLRRLREKAA